MSPSKKILSIVIVAAFLFQCQPSALNSKCDPNGSSYFQTLILLLGTSENTQFCGANIRNPFFGRTKVPRFVLVTNVGVSTATSNINVFRIQPNTGELSQVAGSPFALTNRPRYSVTNAAGNTVYVANVGNTSVSVLSLDPDTGVLSVKHSDLVLSSTPYSLVLDPNGKYLFASSETTQQIHRMAIDSTGNISTIPPATNTSNPTSGAVGKLVFDSLGRHLYAALTGGSGNMSGVQAFSFDSATGGFTSINVYQTSQNNLSLAISANDQFVYGANYFSQDVFPFVRDGGSGGLTIQTSISAGIAPGYTIVDPLNRFVYVANSGTGQGTISAYVINSLTGGLTSVSGSPFSSGFSPIGLGIDPSGKFLYSSNTQGGNVSGYSINGDGSLTPLVGFPVTAGTNPFSIEIVSY
ncbi:lactonase [Leptospira perdikensis]|uniref:Lactonase n=2 Tax=Leptospira perdikensis TaxID=2484948 RepID=A0A4R9J515_9LEPT|nr:lactonase [Leptospira perdikensis]